jgi:hypothetical protein
MPGDRAAISNTEARRKIRVSGTAIALFGFAASLAENLKSKMQ